MCRPPSTKRSTKTVPSPNADGRLALAAGDRLVECGRVANDAHASPAAARRRLDERRQADLVRADSTLESGSTGTPAARINRFASIFEPIAVIAAGGGPIHVRPASITDWANAAFSLRNP